MTFKQDIVENLIDFAPKSNRRAAEGKDTGKYPFYSSGNNQFKFINDYDFENEGIIIGTGGMASLHYNRGNFATSADCIVLQSRNKDIKPKYIYYFLQKNFHLLEIGFRGASLKHISKEYIKNLVVAYPKIESQDYIVNLLDKTSSLIKQRRETIKLTDEFLRSTFLEMFGDSQSMLFMQKDSLNDHIEFLTSGSRGWAKYYSEKGDIFLRIQNVGKAELLLDEIQFVTPPDSAEARRTLVCPNDLLLTITADLGRTAVVPANLGRAYINQHLAIIRFKKSLNPFYAAFFYVMPYGKMEIKKRNREGVKAGLNFEDIRGLPIISPDLKLQNKFSQIVEKTRLLKRTYEQNLEKSEILFNSLMQRAFRGEL